MPARSLKIFAQDTTAPAPEFEQEGVVALEPVPAAQQQESPFSIPGEGSVKAPTLEKTIDGQVDEQAQVLVSPDQPNSTSFETPFLGDPTFWFLVIPFLILPFIIYAVLSSMSKKEIKELQSVEVDPEKEVRGQFKKAERFVSANTDRASFDKSLDEFDAADLSSRVVRVVENAAPANVPSNIGSLAPANSDNLLTTTHDSTGSTSVPFTDDEFGAGDDQDDPYEDSDQDLDHVIKSDHVDLADENHVELEEEITANELDHESPDQIENSTPSPTDEAAVMDLEDDDSDADYNFESNDEVADGDANDAQAVISDAIADEDSAELDAMLDDSDSDLSEALDSETDGVAAKPFDPIGTYDVDDQLDREQLAGDLKSDDVHHAETALATSAGAAASGSIFSRLFGWNKRKTTVDAESTNDDATHESHAATESTSIPEPSRDANQRPAEPESEDFDLGAPAFADDEAASVERLEVQPVKTPNLELDDQDFSPKTPTLTQSLIDDDRAFPSASASAETVREPDRSQSQPEQTPTAELLLTNERLNESIRTLRAELDELAQKFSSTPSASELERLAAQLEASEIARLDLQSELDSVKQIITEQSGDQGSIRPGGESIEQGVSARVGKDNLTQISGIGSKIKKKLYDNGVTSFAQIANWTESDADRFEEVLAINNCIQREKWVCQAKALVEKNR